MTAAFDQVAMDLDAGTPVLLDSANDPGAVRILLIEDGALDRGFLASDLSKQGFAVQMVTSLAAAPDAVGDADVIVLQCDWTKVSSIALLDKLQRQTAGVPIVLLAGEAWPACKVGALDKAAIDVSRSSEVLARRLKHAAKALGRSAQPQADGMVCGKLLLRPDVSRAYWKDADLGLTLGEYNIVHLLASNAGRYVRIVRSTTGCTMRVSSPETVPMAIGPMCDPPSSVSGTNSAASIRPSTRSKTTTVSATAGRNQLSSLIGLSVGAVHQGQSVDGRSTIPG